ncbi:hypothetical protein [Nocardia salmonicida]|uniref:hypothetical protein n=1 Tax=Nocardia salmonicida TaxID=53431 RepID=UPI0007C67AF0|nr:hypothetical protein [Nocardia salmonicida]
MPLPTFGTDDLLMWRLGRTGSGIGVIDSPGVGIDPPPVWVDAITAVASDLRVLRHGRDIDPDRLVWELAITGDDTIMIGWGTTGPVGGFRVGEGTPAASSATTAAVAVADIAQTELGGYEFVQWPSRGSRVLRAREVDGAAVWLDPRTARVISLVGELRADASW